MKYGFISQWFSPETGSAALPTVIAQALRDAGHEVSVITGFPNYPHGQLYEGYQLRLHQVETIGDLTVHRSPLFISHDENPVRRALNYTTFGVSASVTALRYLRHVDAVWVHSTPATAALPAVALRALRKIPFVLHIQDLWPDTVFASGMVAEGKWHAARTLLHTYCDLTYRHAAKIAITAPGMRDALRRRGVPDDKIVDMPNWCDESIFRPVPRSRAVEEELGPFRPFNVMYAGAVGDVQGLDVVLDAAELLLSERAIGFTIVGDGVAKARLRADAERRGLSNVRFLPSQPIDRMPEILALGDVQLVTLRDIALYQMTLPSKVQATLASGRPIICAAGGNAAAVVEAAAAGLTVPPEDASALARAVVDAFQAGPDAREGWGRSGRSYYERALSQAHGVATMTDLLNEVSTAGRR